MRKTHLVGIILLFSSAALATETQETSAIKEGVKPFTSSLTIVSKDALSGLKDGIDEGRQSGSSVDGAVIIYDKDNLKKYTTVRVLSV